MLIKRNKTVRIILAMALVVILMAFVGIQVGWGYQIDSISHEFRAYPPGFSFTNAIYTYRCLNANYHWLTSEVLSPYYVKAGVWTYGAINGCTGHYPIIELESETVKVCVGASDSFVDVGDYLYSHDNNRCSICTRSNGGTGNSLNCTDVFNVYGNIKDSQNNPISGATITTNDGRTAATGANGDYAYGDIPASTYTITPSHPQYTFSPASLSVSRTSYNARNQNFTATLIQMKITSLSPVSAQAGGAAFTLIVNGSDFRSTSVVRWNGSQRPTTFVNSTQLAAQITATDILSSSTAIVTVYDAILGNSNAVNFNTLATLSGKISTSAGVGIAGVSVGANNGITTTTDSNGNYILPGFGSGTYIITPTLTEYTFAPDSRIVMVSLSQSGINFTGTRNTYTISGKVTTNGTTGINGVTVSAGNGITTTTNISGAYTLSGLVAGTYTITASKAEYAFASNNQSVVVGPNQTEINFTGSVITYTISGQITTNGTTALAGVAVSAGGGITATTNSNGNYTLSGLVAGTYTITPSKAEYTFAPTNRSVTVGASKTGVNFTGTIITYTISGKVTTNGTTAISGVSISAGGGNTATTDSNGSYTLTGLVAGTYTLTPSKAEYNFAPGSQPVTVGPSKTAINFTGTVITYTISGQVTTNGTTGLAGATVSAGGGITATSDSNGYYTLSGLVAGTYTITPSKAEYTFAPSSQPVTVGPSRTAINFTCTVLTYTVSGKVLTSGGSGISGVAVTAGDGINATTDSSGGYTLSGLVAGTYTITPALSEYSFAPSSRSVAVGPSKTGVDFTGATTTYAISGRVATITGTGLAGITVSAGGGIMTTTNSSGNYILTGLVSGTYIITPEPSEYIFTPGNRSVTVGPNKTGIDFTASAITYAIAGQVTNGITGLAEVMVSAGNGMTATTDSSGNYTLNDLVAGTYTVTPTKTEYTFAPTNLSVTVGTSKTGVNFTGTRNTYTISGQVLTSDGAAVSGVTMSAGSGMTAMTDSSGNYTLSGLVAGTYTITPTKAEYTFAPTSQSVTVGPSKSEVNFIARRPPAWTFMLYLAGDNNLTSAFTNAIRRLEALPVSSYANINIIVLFDGDRMGDSVRFVVQYQGNYTLGTNRWKMGELNMADPQTLTDFVSWARNNYPAQFYYLAIADHGRGTTGVAEDASSNRDMLTNPELSSALNLATNAGQWKIDILHYDTCLMGLFENAYEVKDYAHYLLASENIGWASFAYEKYVQLANGSVENTVLPLQLAKNVINLYFTHPTVQSRPRTISALDLTKAENLRLAVDELATILKDNLNALKIGIQNSRNSAQKFDSREYNRINYEDEYLDLYHWAQKLKLFVQNEAVQAAAQAVMNTIQTEFVVSEYHQSGILSEFDQYIDLNNAHGVAIYFPPLSGTSDYRNYMNHQTFKFTAQSQWDDFLGDYFGVMGLPPETETIPPRFPNMPNVYPQVFVPILSR